MDDPIYVAFLLRVESNLVAFATFSHYTRSVDDGFELRAASELPGANFNNVLDMIDRGAIKVEDWSSFHRWLGREVGTWATFSTDAARMIVPHWFCDGAENLCRSIGADGNGPFLDIRYGALPREDLAPFDHLTGAVDSDDGKAYVYNIYSNLVITKRRIFDTIQEDETEQ
tara:strand:- start:72 stop:584 length:513 start_codon:yes stop_codon:yes gene_type:complete